MARLAGQAKSPAKAARPAGMARSEAAPQIRSALNGRRVGKPRAARCNPPFMPRSSLTDRPRRQPHQTTPGQTSKTSPIPIQAVPTRAPFLIAAWYKIRYRMVNNVSIIEDAGREMASFFLLGKVNRSHWRRLSAKWSVLIVLLVLLAVFGLLWPPLTDLPPYQALEATTAYLVLWVIAAGYLIYRYGWKNLSVIVMLPCLLMWPTMCLLIMYCHCIIL